MSHLAALNYLRVCSHTSHVSAFSLSSSSSLRPLDVEFMRRLSKVVNIVPVIAKADTLTLEERDFFKQTVRAACRACIYELGLLCRDRLSSTVTFPATGKMFPSMSETKMAVLATGLMPVKEQNLKEGHRTSSLFWLAARALNDPEVV